ncbi:MAG: hypothetical protein IAF08_00510 [Rhizobacter sp.]|nr:hypothetical protein [Chlorobiales bacterium]
MNRDVFELYRQMTSASVVVAFKGAFSQALLVNLGEIIKRQEGDGSKVQKMFSVFIEMAQNILYYSAGREPLTSGLGDSPGEREHVGTGIITIYDSATAYIVSSGNAVDTLRGETMIRRCTHLASLSKAELKAEYHKQRERDAPEGSKGAGLGLIDMMRKSDAPPEFVLLPMNHANGSDDSAANGAAKSETSFFILNITIHKTNLTTEN